MSKFVIRKPKKEVISLRIPADLLQIVDTKASEADVSRNELINQMIIYSLSNMAGSDDKTEQDC